MPIEEAWKVARFTKSSLSLQYIVLHQSQQPFILISVKYNSAAALWNRYHYKSSSLRKYKEEYSLRALNSIVRKQEDVYDYVVGAFNCDLEMIQYACFFNYWRYE